MAQITKSQFSAQLTENEFFQNFRELIAHLSGVTEGISCYLQMNHAEELIALSKAPAPSTYRRLLTTALVTLIDRQALTQLADFNDLAEEELASLRRETGVGVETLLPSPPKPLSVQELLEQRVSSDWNTLKIADFKKNCANDRLYRECFERLSAEDRLGTNAATSLVLAGA